MIPADMVSRMRLLLDTAQPVAPAQPAPPVSPELSPGERFLAQVLTPLPDGRIKAQVSGREVTLSLPQSVSTGDILELEVSHTTAQTVFARLAEPAAAGTTAPRLSPTAQLISQLVSESQGQEQSATAPLARGEPLLPQGVTNSTQIAARLARAVSESGVFYEAHQARWVAGKFSLDALQREPQADFQRSSTAPEATPNPLRAAAEPAPGSQSLARSAGGGSAVQQTADRSAPELSLARAEPAARSAGDSPLAQSVPRELSAVVQQQLDALFTQQLVWHGQAWPGQAMEWEIDLPERPASDTEAAGEDWNTRLRLVLPHLGEVEARLHLTSLGIALHITASESASAQTLDAGMAQLASALEAAGVPLTGHAVVNRNG